MKKISIIRICIWLLALAPIILVAVLYSRLPETIPMNWGLSGEPSRGHKAHIWWLAGLSPAIAGLFMLLPKIDPRGKNYEKFRGFYDAFALFMMLFLLGIVGMILSESFNPGRIQVHFVVIAFLGILFIFLGNMLPKFKSNFFAGIKTPWTLSNNEVWNKTHRLAGFLFFFGGVLITVLNFFISGTLMFVILLGILAVMVLVPIIMSYKWYQKLVENKN